MVEEASSPRATTSALSAKRTVTRRRLVAAALETFTERGIRDTPVEAICERAGFTRGAFYSNFDSKEDLFLELFDERMRELLDRLEGIAAEVVAARAIDDRAELRAALGEIARRCVAAFVDDADWYVLTAEFRAQVLRQPRLQARLAAARQQVYEGLGGTLQEMLHRVGMALTSPPGDAGWLILAVYEHALDDALVAGGQLPTDDVHVASFLPDLLITMVRPAAD